MFYISKEKKHLQPDRMQALLQNTYWAKDRTAEQMQMAIANSVCFGDYDCTTNQQLGLVRVVTDFVCAYYVCDVVVDPAYRGQGIGKALMEAVVTDPEFGHLRGLLVTSDAHGLYEKYGFTSAKSRHMGKEPGK